MYHGYGYTGMWKPALWTNLYSCLSQWYVDTNMDLITLDLSCSKAESKSGPVGYPVQCFQNLPQVAESWHPIITLSSVKMTGHWTYRLKLICWRVQLGKICSVSVLLFTFLSFQQVTTPLTEKWLQNNLSCAIWFSKMLYMLIYWGPCQVKDS